MARFRLAPTPEQEAALLGHCKSARYVWNLALEQWSMWSVGRRSYPPRYVQQARQLTEARAAGEWLRSGSQTVQQQALRDFDQAVTNFFAGTHRRPTWRKAGMHEGFRIVGPQAGRVEKLNRKWARVLVPKVGWVKFRLSGPLPDAKSYRVSRDRAGRWHIAFAVVPEPIPGPGTGEVVGVDRGVTVSAALSTGEKLRVPTLTSGEKRRLRKLQQRLSRARSGSNRRSRTKAAIARLKAREADRRKDWVEQISTRLAREFDVIRVEDLRIVQMTRSAKGTVDNPGKRVRQKAGLNRGILANGWGRLVQRLEHKAAGRVEKIPAAYTSQTCSRCGTRDREARESQAVFRCRSCGYTANADVNAAVNIAAGRAVNARGATAVPVAEKREPQPPTSA
ncbi:RNA-guided endonuclease InsQ/TnpB family protein [Kribbella shirazensis]|uniref:Transposase n=1 Tax=Kribbella shirazensis TaxID=1105143 RepID=A0A7X5VI02_9ACTN|nr:RNA-guided endonuclease TnpB family protein [Kribbella shirazensis]NIK61646.1 transposase [Kribbella shirazensis]